MALFFTEGMRMMLDVDGTDEPVSWGAPAYVPMPLEQLRELPKVGRRSNVPGVYFLWYCKKLVYVGSSKHVLSRVSTHCKYAPVRFDAATFLAVDWPWQFAIEAIYIGHYGPAGNDTHNRKPRLAAQHKTESRNKSGATVDDSKA